MSASIKAAARCAYRDLWRASSTTFSGDIPVLQAFRQKMRIDALNAASPGGALNLEENTKLTREIATILRKNVVQASRIKEKEAADEQEIWRIRLTKDTELGNNETVKSATGVESPRRTRKREKEAQNSTDQPQETSSSARLYYSKLKQAHKQRSVPLLREEDLEESFVRGSGPGGQSINKTSNNVQLLHKPTGIRVACQETRSLETNRKLARRRILEKLDKIENPGLSKGELQAAKQRERERRRRKKAKKQAEGGGI